MAEELQHLIDRIRKEAIAEAEAEANHLVSQARDKAAQLVKEAEDQAKAHLAKAEKEVEVFVRRSKRTLEQAARDVLITVGQGIENILHDIVNETLDEALDADLIQQMLLKIAESYCARQEKESRIEYLISEADQNAIVRFFSEEYRKQLIQGVQIHTDNGILKGFRVSFKDEHVYHDFTRPAIAEALGQFLRQHLSEIVHRAARDASETEGQPDEQETEGRADAPETESTS